MAIWQYVFFLVNKEKIDKNKVDFTNEEYLKWDKTEEFILYEKALDQLLGRERSWSKLTHQYGKIDETVVEINMNREGIESILCRLDLRNHDCSLWRSLFELFIRMNGVLCHDKSFVEISENNVRKELGNSSAARFCKAPYMFLDELSNTKRNDRSTFDLENEKKME